MRMSFSLWTLSYCALSTAAVLPARLRLAQFTEVERLSTGRPGTAVSPPPSGSSRACDTQSRQSAKLFVRSLDLELLNPFTRRRVCPPPPPVTRAGNTRLRERGMGGGGVPIPTRGHSLWPEQGVKTYFTNNKEFPSTDKVTGNPSNVF